MTLQIEQNSGARGTMWGFALALATLAADQFSKLWALAALADGWYEVIPGFLNFRLAMNRGVSFSFLADISHMSLPYALAAVSAIASVVFAILLVKGGSMAYKIALGLMIGGALGNGVDRLLYGAVVDFLDFYYGVYHFPTFNIADTMINIGVALLLLDMLLQTRKEKELKKNNA